MHGPVFARIGWSVAICGGVSALACNPKVHLEFEDGSASLGFDTGVTTEIDESSAGSGDDDDDDTTTSSTSSSPTSSGPYATSGNPTTSTSGFTTSDTSDTEGPLDCYADWQCPDNFRCLSHRCVYVQEPYCDDGCCYYYGYGYGGPECCYGGYDLYGECCEYGIDETGRCITPSCNSNDQCYGQNEVCGPDGACQALTPASICGSASPLGATTIFQNLPLSLSAAVGDFTGNGVADGIVMQNIGTNSLWIVPSHSTSAATLNVPLPEANSIVTALATGDFDGDAIDEVVVSLSRDYDYGSGNGETQILRASTGELLATYSRPLRDLTVTDLDGDGQLDIAGISDVSAHIHFGMGSGSFSGVSLDRGFALAIGDFNGEPGTEVAVSGDQQITIYQVGSDQSVLPIASFPHRASSQHDLLITDVEADDSAELVMLSWVPSGTLMDIWTADQLGGADLEAATQILFADTFFDEVVPAPPSQRYLLMSGDSGVGHIRDISPPCWNSVSAEQVTSVATGFDAQGNGASWSVLAHDFYSNSFRVVEPAPQ